LDREVAIPILKRVQTTAQHPVIHKAFILGAGLGTRLRPLTEHVPKPLVPLYHRPLVEWAMDACAGAGIGEFAINTHHRADAWQHPGPGWHFDGTRRRAENGLPSRNGLWNDLPVELFHEPDLLETGGGLRNIRPWIGDDDILVHNGDIYSSIRLPDLIAAHRDHDWVATLALRSDGPARHIAHADGRVLDIREILGRASGTHTFTGIYCLSPELLDFLPDDEKVSVIPAFLELARQGRLGAVVLDGGDWFDLGDVRSYLDAHRRLRLAEPVHPEARVAVDAVVRDSVIGPGAEIGAGARVEDSVVWPGAAVAAGESLRDAVRTGR
jgi:mannose-1-phosphate guanylyltransferase